MPKKDSSHKKMLLGLLVFVLLALGFFASPLGQGAFLTPATPATFITFSHDDSAAGRARDAQRKSDMMQIATAVELYARDEGGFPNVSGCVTELASGTYSLEDLTTVPSDPSGLVTSLVMRGGCSQSSEGGYAYIALNTNTSNSLAEGYLVVAVLQSSTATGDAAYYYVPSRLRTWTPTTTGSNATADYNKADAKKCTSSTTACDADAIRYYMLGN